MSTDPSVRLLQNLLEKTSSTAGYDEGTSTSNYVNMASPRGSKGTEELGMYRSVPIVDSPRPNASFLGLDQGPRPYVLTENAARLREELAKIEGLDVAPEDYTENYADEGPVVEYGHLGYDLGEEKEKQILEALKRGRLAKAIEEKTAEMRLRGMSYDPNNKNILSLKKRYGSKWKSVLAEQRGIPESSIVEKTAAPEGVERLPSGKLKYRDEIFPGYNKPKAAPKGSKHKKRVLAKKGDKVKVVNFGARGYKHNYSAKAKKSYLARSAGIKGKDDKFSANYWSRRELWPKNQKADGSAKRKKTAQMDSGLSLQYLQDQIDDLSMAAMGPKPAIPRHMQRAQIRRQSGFNAEAAVAKIDRLGSKLDTLMSQQEQARQQAAQSVGRLPSALSPSSSSGATVSNNIVFPAPTGDPSQDLMASVGKNVALPAGVAALAAALVNNFSKKSSLKKN